MKVQVSPLVLAAALGLLGPAALADEESDDQVSGLWKRRPMTPTAKGAPQRDLGERIELVTVEDRVLLDDGSGQLLTAAGTWTTIQPDLLVQTIAVDGGRIVREFL